jgi:hypothetical protein
MEEIIIKIKPLDTPFLNSLKNYQNVWEYSPPLDSAPYEAGKIVTKQCIFKFYAENEKKEEKMKILEIKIIFKNNLEKSFIFRGTLEEIIEIYENFHDAIQKKNTFFLYENGGIRVDEIIAYTIIEETDSLRKSK